MRNFVSVFLFSLCSLCIVTLSLSKCFAQSNLYSLDTIQKIEITFPNANWDFVMDTAKAGADGYTLATEVKINGVSFDSVGVRYKGNSSYDSTQQKNPLHIKLDFVHSNANYNGYEDIKVSNGFGDPSGIREMLAYEIARNYMDAPLSNFAKVYINGIYYGVYSSSENIDGNFLDKHFYTSTGTFIKGNPENVATGHIPNLVYLGTDSALYYDRYELKSDYAWKDLIQLCDAIANAPATIDSFMDVDRALWMIAFNDVTVNLDSYSGQFAQNYYLYRDHNNRFNPVVWDLNMCFGSFTNTGTANLNLTSEQQLTPLLHSSNASRPLIKQLLADSTYRKMYIAHAKTIADEMFNGSYYLTLANIFQNLIDTSVQAENFSLYTYPEFQNGLSTSVGGVPGIQELMSGRIVYLNSTPEFQQVAPFISSFNNSPVTPAFGNNVSFVADVTGAVKVYLGYRYSKSEKFTRVEMFDDGLHNDGASGDGQYGVSIPCSSLEIQYYFYAENSDAGIFSPQRAEHEFWLLNPSITYATANDVVLNEFMTNNTMSIVNEDGKHKDWIELYNKTNNALGLKNLFLSDDIADMQKWKFPDNSFVSANGYFLIWADDKDSTLLECHSNFNLNEAGDSLFLSTSSSQIADSVAFISFPSDYSLERCPDGTGAFTETFSPTPRSMNCPYAIEKLAVGNLQLAVYPNPASDVLAIDLGSAERQLAIDKIEIADVLRRKVFDANPKLETRNLKLTLDVRDLVSGIYFLSVKTEDGKIICRKFVKE